MTKQFEKLKVEEITGLITASLMIVSFVFITYYFVSCK